MSLCVGVAKYHMTALPYFFRENLLMLRQRLVTFLGSPFMLQSHHCIITLLGRLLEGDQACTLLHTLLLQDGLRQLQ